MMMCEHCHGEREYPATRTFDVPGSSLVHLCEIHAADRPSSATELVQVDLDCSDIGITAELVDGAAHHSSFIVPRSTYARWAATRAAWEDVQAEMSTELAKGSVDALALSSGLNGNDRRSA